jgi:hypothetical protein
LKSPLAQELLAAVMGWEHTDFAEKVTNLEALALYKWDEYDNFRPGVKFFESLAAWLDQFADGDERAIALEFVLERLVFVSDAEMTHLIELVYPDHIEPVLLDRVAHETGISRYAVAQLVAHSAFLALRRRSLILGASDGARLDRLRRSAPVLSHEQFLQASEPPVSLVKPMCSKLVEGLQKQGLEASTTFAHVFLVDDFSGSGETLLRWDKDKPDGPEVLKGKLLKLRCAIAELIEQKLVSPDAAVTVVLYVASQQAREHLESILPDAEISDWEIRVVQPLPSAIRVTEVDEAMAELSRRYYDAVCTDEHKGEVPLGYSDCALPLVLSHNTPNNSICLLWADTTEEEGSLKRRALFPRYERHHKDRP